MPLTIEYECTSDINPALGIEIETQTQTPLFPDAFALCGGVDYDDLKRIVQLSMLSYRKGGVVYEDRASVRPKVTTEVEVEVECGSRVQ
jgi:hypothetical protein